jgi:polyphosphate glucokinase
MTIAVGIDIGGTGMKGALVDLNSGLIVSERIKRATPIGGSPSDIIHTTAEILDALEAPKDAAVGVCFPAIVIAGRTLSAANVSDDWIGLDAESLFESRLRREIHFINDADAAGVAEAHYGAAANHPGLVILTTLGTGIGSAFLHDGVLLPNTELGHLELDGADVETWASNSAREREGLDFADWARRLQRFYSHVEFLFSPDLLVVGGGVSKHHEKFLPRLDLRAPIVPAALRNNAGILGAAALAHRPAIASD